MKIILLVLSVLVGFFIAKVLLPVKGMKQITTSELRGILKSKDHEFIDVRSPGEYKVNHIKQFKNIPLQQLDQNLQKISKEKEIVIICQSGMRSMQACRKLKKRGFNNLTNVKSGMNGW